MTKTSSVFAIIHGCFKFLGKQNKYLINCEMRHEEILVLGIGGFVEMVFVFSLYFIGLKNAVIVSTPILHSSNSQR